MLVLSIDPGNHTGIALVNEDGDVEYTAAPDVLTVLNALSDLRWQHKVTHVVMETPPLRSFGDRAIWVRCHDYVRMLLPHLQVIAFSPGHWKPFLSILKRPTDKFATQHEKDAVYLARYFIRRELVK